MATQIVLTLDFFLRDWNDVTPANAELWACVQPHVIKGADATEFTSLGEWIRGSERGASFEYKLSSPSFEDGVVPVNFCDDVDVSLEIVRASGTTTITNDRRNGIFVRDEAAATEIARVNRQPEETKTNAIEEQKDVVDVLPGPFAVGYNRTLRLALAAQPGVPEGERLELRDFGEILALAFWGGTRRYIPLSTINAGNVALMRLPETDASLIVTNLHSLCGLMFRIGTRATLGELRAIEDLRIVLNDRASTLPVTGHDANASASIKTFFSRLPDTIVLADPPRAKWDATAATRVYAFDHFAALTHESKIGPWYRRESESSVVAQHRLLSAMHRLVVRFDEQRPAPAALPSWQRLNWQVWDAFAINVTPYRRFAASRSTTGNTPLHIQPAPSDRQRFYDELRRDPQLFTRGDARIVDAGGVDHAASLQFIGSFDFPWDRAAGELEPAACPPRDDRTVVMHGPVTTPQALTLLVPRRDGAGAPIVLETARRGDDDTFGPRWEHESNPGTLPPLHFTHLQCTDLPDAALAGNLKPAIAFDRDLRFEFAQSASSIEGQLTATFPHGTGVKLEDPNAVDPVDEFVHDLVNHNALNVYGFWGGQPLRADGGPQPGRKAGHLNPNGQIYPDVSTRNGSVEYVVPFRHRLSPTTPPADRAPQSPRQFFRDVYSRIGQPRTLSFDFEHTYGTQLALPIDGGASSVSGLSSHFDFDLVTPPDVTRTGEPGAGCPPTDASDFLTVAYERSAGRELLRFMLHTRWLRGEYAVCGNGSMRATHIAAWRAIAEVAHASEVRVTGLFRRFDFHTALASCDRDGIAAGLTPVKEFEDRVWVVPPAKLSLRCRELLDADAFADVETFEIVLTEPSEQPKVFESCNVIEIFLTTARDATRLARPEQPWSLVKPLPQKRRGAGDPAFAGAGSPDSKEIFDSYLASIAGKQSVVRPSFANEQQESEAARFRRLLGNGVSAAGDATSRREQDPGAWILPEGIAAAATGSIVPSVCPLTFRAPALDPLLGPLTFELLRKYFRLLQAIIDCDFSGATSFTQPQWAEHFTLLDQAARHLEDSESIFDAVLDSVLPIPDVAATIDSEVRDVAIALRDPSSPAATALRRWLSHRLWREPAMFADAKALLFHRLRPASGSLPPADFFALESSREISVAHANESSSATFRQTLVDLHDTEWFGAGEILDDIRYDNDFFFRSYRMPSFEGVVSDPQQQPLPNARLEVPVESRLLHLPGGTQHLDQPDTAKPVFLASRAPLVAPAHVFTGMLAELQSGAVLAQVRNRRLSLEALKRGVLTNANAGEPAVMLAGSTSDIGTRPRLDEYVLSAVFAIHGDEETAVAWRSAFDNDEIRIHPRTNEIAMETTLAAAASGEIAQLFAAIGETSHMHQAKVAPRLALAPEAMSFVNRILRTRPEAPPAQAAPAVRIHHRDGAGDCVSMTLTVPPGDSLTGRLQTLLFAASPENLSSPCDESVPRTTFILMVNCIVPVWNRTAIGIAHLRNAREGFAPDLTQTSQVVLPDRFHQPFLDTRGPELTLPRRPHTTREIVDKLGFSNSADWRTHDISITVSHRQLRRFPAATLPANQIAIAQESSFPLANARHTSGESGEAPIVELDPAYDDFLIDLQWSSATNLQFFRVNGCRIRVA